MGRAYEVRKASIAATGKAKSALYMKASREIYMAAKGGSPDPRENLALRAVLEKYKGQSIPKDVIQRAIDKAQGKGAEDYISATYEGFGPGQSMIIVETLSDNAKRAFSEVRAVFNHKGGKIADSGSVSYNFQRLGELDFKGSDPDNITENLIMDDIDVKEVKTMEDGVISVLVAPTDLSRAEKVLRDLGIEEFLANEITLIPDQTIELTGEELEKYQNFVDALNELDDVQTVYTNVVL
ncbi:MAG: YebC/PmpR family DNA-binding transcriptional regulator [Firmicutes bacterium]|uniref:Probable transcriptional regulatory protein IAC78_04335 n=1 Tax=Candidatus Scatoplasma merdavium TaxID=2840932 RepID=A0A9D9DAT7_9BACL|nr:YebC/PmpR family DNA-binding transcriptional regulator [Candidatus Scatoplasma merdavium]